MDMGSHAMLLQGGNIALHAPSEEVLSSPLLDETYGVEFKRFRDEEGRLRVFPALPQKVAG